MLCLVELTLCYLCGRRTYSWHAMRVGSCRERCRAVEHPGPLDGGARGVIDDDICYLFEAALA